jgi:hypothetical protein
MIKIAFEIFLQSMAHLAKIDVGWFFGELGSELDSLRELIAAT